jgi:hypothetical protein
MHGLKRIGHTFYVRYLVPKNRQADVGRAYGSPRGSKKRSVRSLKTTDKRDALTR